MVTLICPIHDYSIPHPHGINFAEGVPNLSCSAEGQYCIGRADCCGSNPCINNFCGTSGACIPVNSGVCDNDADCCNSNRLSPNATCLNKVCTATCSPSWGTCGTAGDCCQTDAECLNSQCCAPAGASCGDNCRVPVAIAPTTRQVLIGRRGAATQPATNGSKRIASGVPGAPAPASVTARRSIRALLATQIRQPQIARRRSMRLAATRCLRLATQTM